MAENSPPRNYYADLGVTPNASAAQIKAAYHQLARQHHPDKKDPADNDSSEFRKAHEAYEQLYVTDLRAKYDETLRTTGNAECRPFNIFNPHRTHSNPSAHPNAKFHDTATEFEEEEPIFSNAHSRESPWNPQHNRSYSSPQSILTAHGLRVNMTEHPAGSVVGGKCSYKAEEWHKQSGTDICIFCLTSRQGAHRCPACEAVACAGCLEKIKEVVRQKANSWWHGPQTRSSGG